MRETTMRLKPDGSLDYRPVDPLQSGRGRTAEELDRMRERILENMLHAHPGMTRERAEDELDSFF
jgi:hypothetical protein